ncbi:MAG: cytochrome c-type biogenesis protein CcmH [Actinomycetota bacterium]|nr:cytochrome c-type biogenesis protein CcmH [Actinomycetota bacterium]
MRRTLLAALAAALLAPAGAMAASCPQASVGDLEDEVQCLDCGVPLQLATESPQANRQRALIGRLVDSCRSKEEIKDRLVAEFGPRVLTTPDDEGFDLVAWLVPVLALLAGGAGIALTARRWRRSGRSGRSAGGEPPADGGRIDADLERYEL